MLFLPYYVNAILVKKQQAKQKKKNVYTEQSEHP